jgi:hypothetical protein
MAEQITYYALLSEESTVENPAGVFRRVKTDQGQVDEVFSRNLKWEFSPLLYSSERGDTTYDFVPISEEEANRIVDRLRRAT